MNHALQSSRAIQSSLGRATTGALAMVLALGAVTVAPTPQARAADGAPQDNTLVLAVGESRVVNLSANLSDVVIANPAVIDVHVRSQRQIYIIAKAPGQTNIFVTTKDGQMLYANGVRVGNNLTSMDQMLKLAMPEAKVQISTMNGLVLLTGTVAAPEDAAEAERLVQAFAGKDIQVLSRLRTATPLQVNLQVRIAEVNKNFVKNVGFNFATSNTGSGFLFGIGQGRTIINTQWVPGGPTLGVGNGIIPTGNASAIGALTSGTTLGGMGNVLGLDILGALDLAETQGLASTLANPNLTALSGETASFLAGGEIPIPIGQGNNAVSIDYKQYGVSLAFTPTVLADGRISMRVRPEVSQLDDGASVKLNGFSIPGISTRRAETTVELGSGQSFMIGGLLSASSGNSVNKAPFLGDLPIVGNLFKSQQWNRRETELVIIVTPYLVRPVDAKEIALPTDGYRGPDDAERLLAGQLHAGQSGGQRPKPELAPPVAITPGEIGSSRSDRTAQKTDGKSADKTRGKSASAATPGFSF